MNGPLCRLERIWLNPTSHRSGRPGAPAEDRGGVPALTNRATPRRQRLPHLPHSHHPGQSAVAGTGRVAPWPRYPGTPIGGGGTQPPSTGGGGPQPPDGPAPTGGGGPQPPDGPAPAGGAADDGTGGESAAGAAPVTDEVARAALEPGHPPARIPAGGPAALSCAAGAAARLPITAARYLGPVEHHNH